MKDDEALLIDLLTHKMMEGLWFAAPNTAVAYAGAIFLRARYVREVSPEPELVLSDRCRGDDLSQRPNLGRNETLP